MPTLKLSKGVTRELPGLGRNTSFQELSKQRITKAIRQGLRKEFGFSMVGVSCDADLKDGAWQGRCRIHGDELAYRFHPL